MPVSQLATFISLLPRIEEVLQSKGETIPRPDFDGAQATRQTSGDDSTNDRKEGKRNFEETSDEES